MKLRLRRPMENYKERHCGCAPGTHAALAELIRTHVMPQAGVLDIGAHAGALLLRLEDFGFCDLHGVDLDPTRFAVPGASFYRLDLNQDFVHTLNRKFKLITATDVIEHLDSPRHFLSQIYAILEDDGWLGLSLPNVAFWEGRIKFVLRGELWGFGSKCYRAQRHISPITFEQMLLMLQELGFEPVAWASAGSFATKLRWVLTAPLWIPLRLFGGPRTFGESAIFLARKAEPIADLRKPLHYRNRWQGIPDKVGIEDNT